jgi:hypothetical protein
MCDARDTEARFGVATTGTQDHESRKSALDERLAEQAGNAEIVARLYVAGKRKSVSRLITLFAGWPHFDTCRPGGANQ